LANFDIIKKKPYFLGRALRKYGLSLPYKGHFIRKAEKSLVRLDSFSGEGLILINFELHMPTKIIFGKGESARAGEVIKEYGKKALLVTGKTSTKKTGSLQKITQSMEQAGLKYIIFDQI